MTQGTYGNPRVKSPLQNFSQINCAQPDDKTPPCKQELAIKATTCEDYYLTQPCSPKTFSNLITWKRTRDVICRQDIKSYNVYRADNINDVYRLTARNIVDTFYVDNNLPSFARCYKFLL